jgi:hypothetical protein
MTTAEQIAIIDEALAEIRRLNSAAGHTVFNPAAKELLFALRGELAGKEG